MGLCGRVACGMGELEGVVGGDWRGAEVEVVVREIGRIL